MYCVCSCVCSSACEDQSLKSSVFLCYSPPYVLSRGLSLNLELTIWARLVRLAGIYLSAHLLLGLQVAAAITRFCVGAEDLNSRPHPHVTLYPLSHLPSSTNEIFFLKGKRFVDGLGNLGDYMNFMFGGIERRSYSLPQPGLELCMYPGLALDSC